MEVTAVKMPAGLYWVGDPCYAIPQDRWMEWLEDADFEDNRRLLVGKIDGITAVGVGTAYGDGTYRDEEGHSYGVDAGLLGVVPAELSEEETADGCRLVEFESDFECRYEDGVVVLGHIEIDTGD